MNALFVVALTIGMLAIAAAGGIYLHFKRKFKDSHHQGGAAAH